MCDVLMPVRRQFLCRFIVVFASDCFLFMAWYLLLVWSHCDSSHFILLRVAKYMKDFTFVCIYSCIIDVFNIIYCYQLLVHVQDINSSSQFIHVLEKEFVCVCVVFCLFFSIFNGGEGGDRELRMLNCYALSRDPPPPPFHPSPTHFS